MTDDLAALLRACILAPADAAPRLVLSDYLEETGLATTEQAAALRDGTGDWLVGPGHKAIWFFAGEPATLDVGQVPADARPRCVACKAEANLRHLSDMWLCSVCRFGTTTGRFVTARAASRIQIGEAVCIGSDGRARPATAKDTIIGYAMDSGVGRVTMRLV